MLSFIPDQFERVFEKDSCSLIVTLQTENPNPRCNQNCSGGINIQLFFPTAKPRIGVKAAVNLCPALSLYPPKKKFKRQDNYTQTELRKEILKGISQLNS